MARMWGGLALAAAAVAAHRWQIAVAVAALFIGYAVWFTSPPVMRFWLEAKTVGKLGRIALFTVASILIVGGLVAWMLFDAARQTSA